MSIEKKGLDLSGWNEVEDYKKVADSGVDFTILKVINKSNNVDKRYRIHLAGCKAADIDVIAGYTYAYTNTENKAKQSSAAFVDIAGNDVKIMVLDLEDVTMMGLGGRIVDIINIYREAAEGAGMDFVIYTGAQFYNPYLKPYASQIADIPIWWARYPSVATKLISDNVPSKKYLPVIPNDIVGWQYSSKGSIPGIKGFVDLNVWYKEVAADVPMLQSISTDINPFAEPTTTVKYGTVGEGAKWVQWYLWRFGLLLTNGVPDSAKINGIINEECEAMIKEAQRRLGLTGKEVDGKVGSITKALFKKTV